MKLVTHLHLELKFRMSTTMPVHITIYCVHTDKFACTFTFFSSVYICMLGMFINVVGINVFRE